MKAALVDRRENEEQGTYRANDARLAATLGVDLKGIRPDLTVASLTELAAHLR
jgi:hypothetical protein